MIIISWTWATLGSVGLIFCVWIFIHNLLASGMLNAFLNCVPLIIMSVAGILCAPTFIAPKSKYYKWHVRFLSIILTLYCSMFLLMTGGWGAYPLIGLSIFIIFLSLITLIATFKI